jgi:hypothetical protein
VHGSTPIVYHFTAIAIFLPTNYSKLSDLVKKRCVSGKKWEASFTPLNHRDPVMKSKPAGKSPREL